MRMALGLVLILSFPAWAVDSVQVRKDLEIINRVILLKRTQSATLRLNAAVRPETVLELDRARYQVGQHWLLAVALTPLDQARMDEPVVDRNPSSYAPALLRFEVKESGAERTVIAVRRQGGADQAIVTLDSKNRLITAQNASLIGAFDLFPLSVPRYDVAEAEPVERMPILPPGLAQVLPSGTFIPQSLANAFAYRSEDSVGRSIEVIWRKKDPWPIFMRGPAGVAVLAEEH